MKSILAKQAPQMSPCLPMRARQTMQTGGRRRSASGERSDVNEHGEGTPLRGFHGPWRYCGIRLAHRHGSHDRAECAAGLEGPMDRAS